MIDHYAILGLTPTASKAEVRRAYRILARRYHPDVNPDSSPERFEAISEAYKVLNDPDARHNFDLQYEDLLVENAHSRLKGKPLNGDRPGTDNLSTAEDKFSTGYRFGEVRRFRTLEEEMELASGKGGILDAPQEPLVSRFKKIINAIDEWLELLWFERIKPTLKSMVQRQQSEISRISILELSLSMKEVLGGVKKVIEYPDGDQTRRVSINIPPGSASGSVIRLRSKQHTGEELVIIVRLTPDRNIQIERKGAVLTVPISISEAITGANVSVPTLEEPVVIRIPPGSQSGDELRVNGKGIALKDGTQGDLFIKLVVVIPNNINAVGLREKAIELEKYYEAPVRNALPKKLGE